MKRTARVLSLIVVLCLAVSMLAPLAGAANSETVKQYGKEGGYLAFGDSICRGFASAGYPDHYYNYEKRNVEGAYPHTVATAVGCTMPEDLFDHEGNYWPVCYPGVTLTTVTDLLGVDDGFVDDEFVYGCYEYSHYRNQMVPYWGGDYSAWEYADRERPTVVGKAGDVRELAAQASLITVEVGMCDVFYRPLAIATEKYFPDGLDLGGADTETLLGFVGEYLDLVGKDFDYWSKAFPLFISELRALNPDATIVVVGSFNMISEITLTDDTLLPVGSTVTALTASMNALYRQWADTYGYLFADISNLQSYGTECGWSFLGEEWMANRDEATHPSAAGNYYIARAILNVLPEQDEKEPVVTNDIKVDLARFNKVNFVFVDGRLVTDYTLEGYTLTVPYNSPNAKFLSVTIVDESGRVAVVTYQLAFHADEGYVPYRMYTNVDVFGTAVKLVTNIFTAGAEGLKSLVGLFK